MEGTCLIAFSLSDNENWITRKLCYREDDHAMRPIWLPLISWRVGLESSSTRSSPPHL